MSAIKFLKDRNHTISAIECRDDNLSQGSMDLIQLMEDYAKEQVSINTPFFCEGQYDEGGDGCDTQCESCKNI